MSSTIFYRFMHQKDQSTIYFDGTGINVFDLKHEIITQNLLGQGMDFMLRLYHLEQMDLEYENDQDVIPRSTFVIARRSPVSVFSGLSQSAARYISGRPRVTKFKLQAAATQKPAAIKQDTHMDETISEEDRIKLMFENQSNVWAQAQDELSQHKVVHYKPGAEDLPPPGYVCYRCGGKDHWIKNCPTNSDPNFEGKKIKKTTGIPKSYMKTISKETVEYRLQNPESNDSGIHTDENGDLVDAEGNTYMITEDGDYVMTFADSKTWTLYQEKQLSAASKAQRQFEQKVANRAVADKRSEFLNPLFVEPKILKTPIRMTSCCQDKSALKKLKNFNFNQSELEQELIENDFHCPNCGNEDVFIDSLISNEAFEKELNEYITLLGLEDPSAVKRSASEVLDEEAADHKRYELSDPIMPVAGMPLPMVPMMPVSPMFMAPGNRSFHQSPEILPRK